MYLVLYTDVNGSGDDQLVFRDERVLSARLSVLPPPSPPLAPAAGRPYRLHIDRSRQLDRLHLRAIEYPPLGPDEVEVDVEAAGLNFLDVVMALGMIPELLNDSEEGPDLGVELAGRVRAVGANVTTLRVGDRVMGPVVRCFGSRTRTNTSLLVKIPETLTFAEAATIPVVFLTAWLGLVHRARLRPGERVLIHAGTGGVGMAAIQIAQHLGAEVYATAGSEAKRALLVSLGVRHVFDSRSLSFVDGILAQTNGEGVDVVLNSLAEPLLSASVSILRNDGRFVEVGKRDYFANAQFGLRPFLKRLSFSLVDLNSVRTDRLELTHQLFAEILPLFSEKKLRPLPSKIMPLSEATAAFSAMARGEHTGKIVLVPDENPLILPAVGVAADSSVLITGGLGGLGLQVTRWLAAHGSPRLWLLGRRAPDATQESAIAALRQLGARIEVIQGDVADARSLDGVLAKVRAAGPPLRGVVHTAGVVLDRTIGDLDAETTRAQLRPKVQGAWNLHRACAGDRLDFFVLFSSLAGLMGSAGQSAYAASNALLDGLAELRRSKGLPALSIAWGAWGEVGMAASPALLERMMADGVQPIEPGRGTQTFGQLLQASPPVVGVAPMSWERWAAQNRVRARTPFFQPLVPTEDVQGGEAGRSVQASLSALAPAEREAWIIERLREQVAAVLRIPASRVDPALAMSVLGFDSLMTVELRSRIETTFEASVPLATLIRAESLTAVAAMVLNSLTPRLAAGATSSAAPVAQVSPTAQAAPAIQAAPVAPTAPTASARSVVSVHAPVAVPTSVVRSVTTVAKASAPERASLPSLLIHFDPEHAFEPFPQTDMQQAYEIGEQDGFPLGGVSYLYYREFEKEQPDLDHLERTWNQIVQRHSMLRCVFLDDGTARILPDVPFYRFEVYDLSGFAEGSPEQHAAALELRARLSSLRVNTKRWPLFQIFAIRLGGNRIRLCLAVAMTVCDAMSLRTAAYEWCQLILGRGSLKPLTLSFRDYQLAVKRMEQTEAFERARRFWMDKLDRIPPAPALPLTKPLFDIQASARRVCHAMRIESSIWNRLRANAVAAGVTPSVALCTAFSDVLAAWSESRHFTLNLPSFNRPPVHPEVGRLVGELVSTMLLEVRHDGATFTERAQAIHLQLLENLEHQLFPGVRVLGEMSRRGGIVLMPVVFSSTVGHRPPPDETEVAEAGMGKTVYTATTTPQVLLDHILTEEAGDLVLTWDVIEEAFPPGLIASMFDAYRELLYRLADGTEAWTSPRRRLLPAAQRSVRAAVNATDAPIAPSLLHELVFDCAARHPERLAIVSGPQLLSYGELALRSTALAQALRDRGLRVGSPVAILIPKGWQQVVATLGILLAGGVVAPIDTEAPTPRVLQILELSGAGHLLISGESNLHRDGLAVLDVDTLALAEPRSSTSSFPRCQQTDPAYLIFTSGSTGTPKGVLLGHRGFVNMVHETVARLAITDRDCALGLTSLHHDLSIFDIFGLLSVGGKLVLPDADRYRDPAHWTELIARHGVTFWNSVPALLEMLLLHFERRSAVFPDGGEPGAGVAELHSLRLVSLGGDWIALSQPARLLALVPRVQMISVGGPTETSVWNIWHRIEKLDPSWPSIPYGRPTANARYYVLDDQLEDRPDWVGGTMWCAGAGLALGYFQDETRTREAFRIHPDTGERIYNTGDRGRYHPDGTLEFLGRADLQVKIRGVRIELAECDAALSSHPFVRQAVIVAQGSPQTGERWLAAFVSPTEAALATTHEASAFKMQRYGQRRFQAESAGIELPSHPQAPLTRVSQRTFTSELVPLSQLADLLAVLQAVNEPGQASSRHRYPSGGGLYPLETYVYAHRVDGLERGTYYYDAFAHRLVQITLGATLDTSWHVPHNRSIVAESAFSIFLVGDMDAIEPLYGPFARDMCLLEAGYMGQLLATEAGRLGVGLCPIGGMDTVPLGPLLRLTARQLVLHSFEGGIPDNTRSAPGPQQAFINDLRAHMEARLPAAMVPTRFHVLRDLPLSANGKIDRKQLTAQVIASGPPAGDATANKAPESETERFIIEHLCRELDIPSLDAEANFFHAGASSIHLAALATVLSNRVGRTISIMALFERPTARKLGEWLTGSSNMEEDPVARARVRGTRRRERRDVRGE